MSDNCRQTLKVPPFELSDGGVNASSGHTADFFVPKMQQMFDKSAYMWYNIS